MALVCYSAMANAIGAELQLPSSSSPLAVHQGSGEGVLDVGFLDHLAVRSAAVHQSAWVLAVSCVPCRVAGPTGAVGATVTICWRGPLRIVPSQRSGA